MSWIFKKELMLKRAHENKMDDFIGETELAIMDKLDGKEAILNKWKETVYDEREWCITVDGKTYPVNLDDCIKCESN